MLFAMSNQSSMSLVQEFGVFCQYMCMKLWQANLLAHKDTLSDASISVLTVAGCRS